ncbi:MAG: FAD-binding and (Fe-S)-binding domain-containing protein [Planctomycetota bacterium]
MLQTASNGHETDPARLGRALRQACRGAVYDNAAGRGLYAQDASHYQVMPAAALAPADEQDLLAALTVAQDLSAAITGRGAGTSLSGQTHGPGLVLDFSRHLNQILEVDVEARTARVQPGVVRDRLNADPRLRDAGLHFAPDPATAGWATVGGMTGNNSAGMRSIVYGKTIDHILGLRVALADGTVLDLTPHDLAAWRQAESRPGREGELYRGVRQLVDTHADRIRGAYPNLMRRVAGYNLDEFVTGAGYLGPIGPRAQRNAGPRNDRSLHHLVVGAEGTLALVLEATIRLTPLPKATALALPHFDGCVASLAAVPAINELGPSAVELLDGGVLKEAKRNAATKHLADFIEGEPEALLIVEFQGETEQEAAARAHELAAKLESDASVRASLRGCPVRTDAAGQQRVWQTRALGLGLISNQPGDRKGQAFVEDACVPVERLADYIDALTHATAQRGLPYSMYAHASVGVIHFRPGIDLHTDEDRDHMHAISERALELCLERGGSFSGEHGDGIVRGQWLERQFGPELYQAFRDLKGLFDPTGRMNPGKIIDPPRLNDPAVLRYGDAYRLAEIPATYRHETQGGFVKAVEQCNGVGACRKVGAGVMCPSYMATRNEQDTTRGRANALRLAMSNQLGAPAEEALAGDELHEVLELCLSCKACKTECPNAVDMAKLKADATQVRHDQRGVPLSAKAIGASPGLARRLAGPLAPIVNALQNAPGAGWMRQKLLGFDRKRPAPPFAAKPFPTRWKAFQQSHEYKSRGPATRGPAVLLVDSFNGYFEPGTAIAAARLLHGLGYELTPYASGCCQRPRLSQGLLREAAELTQPVAADLDRLLSERPGAPLVALEPSCASAWADDLPDLLPDPDPAKRVAQRLVMLDTLLDQITANEPGALQPAPNVSNVAFHAHCHHKALFDADAIVRVFERAGAACQRIDAGCCGLAGAFGYQHHEVSGKIGEDRLFPAVRSAVQQGHAVAATGVSCRHQLRDWLGVEARHPAELLEAAPNNA